MPFRLHPSCENFVGQTIYVRPVGGWGWCRRDEESPGPMSVPLPFLLRVQRLTHHRGELNGFIGRVETPEHLFDGLWAVTYLRYGGDWDMTSSIPMNDILLGPEEPYLRTLADEPKLERWYREKGKEPWHPLWEFDGSPQFGGQTYLASTREIGDAYFEKEFGAHA